MLLAAMPAICLAGDKKNDLLAPPFIYEPKHIDELVGKLAKTLNGVRFT